MRLGLTPLIQMICLPGLAGCVQPGTAIQMATAMTSFSGVTAAAQPASKEDYVLACSELNGRLGNLYDRYRALEAAQQARQRQSAVMDGVLDAGLGILGTKAATGAGSVSAIRGAQVAMTASDGLVSVMRAEGSASDLKSVNDATMIAQRTAQLERVKFEKGCK